ncbi:hypothetical protein B0H66DRAFT_215870 [Apodospora peruviana]|uniref:Uncharacterized protein n=1 Tax=Apodospora peruviana TaxID=516989 RepID=A0AAE0ID81_9PEZI|nr:hypothetical protein B0H66DRAFT_215870 [Apodospora peruviana]
MRLDRVMATAAAMLTLGHSAVLLTSTPSPFGLPANDPPPAVKARDAAGFVDKARIQAQHEGSRVLGKVHVGPVVLETTDGHSWRVNDLASGSVLVSTPSHDDPPVDPPALAPRGEATHCPKLDDKPIVIRQLLPPTSHDGPPVDPPAFVAPKDEVTHLPNIDKPLPFITIRSKPNSQPHHKAATTMPRDDTFDDNSDNEEEEHFVSATNSTTAIIKRDEYGGGNAACIRSYRHSLNDVRWEIDYEHNVDYAGDGCATTDDLHKEFDSHESCGPVWDWTCTPRGKNSRNRAPGVTVSFQSKRMCYDKTLKEVVQEITGMEPKPKCWVFE